MHAICRHSRCSYCCIDGGREAGIDEARHNLLARISVNTVSILEQVHNIDCLYVGAKKTFVKVSHSFLN